MPYVDPDNANPRLVSELAKLYEASAERLRAIVLTPPGRTPGAIEFNQARAAQLLNQVQSEIDRLKHQAASWTSKALQEALQKGLQIADRQVKEAGLAPGNAPQASFARVNRRVVDTLARDTLDDLLKAADSLQKQVTTALRHMAATGVSNAEVNRILAGGIIEGQPTRAIRELRDALQKVYDDKVTIQTKIGPMEFDVDYYARMVANSKMRQATVLSRHQRLAEHGIDLVRVVGRISKYPCSLLLGHVFSLSGESRKYPAWDSVSEGQMPYHLFHPNCTKSTVPFIEELASKVSQEVAEGRGGDTPTDRVSTLVEDIRSRARANGYTPPPHGSAE